MLTIIFLGAAALLALLAAVNRPAGAGVLFLSLAVLLLVTLEAVRAYSGHPLVLLPV